MYPTLSNNQLVLMKKGSNDLKRGDLVIVKIGKTEYVKRVVGLPGDQVEGRNNQVYVNQQKYQLSAYDPKAKFSDFLVGEIPNGSVFVLGDNLQKSYDSRRIGPVPISLIKGKVILY